MSIDRVEGTAILNGPKIQIHVGVHKTATTYIQDTLALNRAASAAAGTAYWKREHFRPTVSSAIWNEAVRRRSRLAKVSARLWPRPNSAISSLSNFFKTDHNVTISEENLIGEAKDCLSGQFYPFAPDYLGVLAQALPDRPVEILIALRSYDSFSSSLYGEALRHGHYLRMKRFQEMHASSLGAWPALIETIRKTFPTASILAWKYEDFRSVADDVLARLSGLEKEALTKPAQADILPSASGEAILAFTSQAQALQPLERRLLMLALEAKLPLVGTRSKFTLWDEGQKAKLTDEYELDLERIKASGHADFLA